MDPDEFDQTENHYLNDSPMDESINHRAESYHLEDLGDQVIEEKAEEEETSTVQVYTNNKDITEGFNTNIDCEISDDDIKIMDEDGISRRSINSSLINIKRTKMFGAKSDL